MARPTCKHKVHRAGQWPDELLLPSLIFLLLVCCYSDLNGQFVNPSDSSGAVDRGWLEGFAVNGAESPVKSSSPQKSNRTAATIAKQNAKKAANMAHQSSRQPSERGHRPNSSHFLRDHQAEDLGGLDGGMSSHAYKQQVSITPRVSIIRVPVESNAILKCLISSSQAASKFAKKFNVHWSRFLYHEGLYEQIEKPSAQSTTASSVVNEAEESSRQARAASPAVSSVGARALLDNQYSAQSRKLYGFIAKASREPQSELSDSLGAGFAAASRQEALADFVSRSRQETNSISDLLIEATLSVSPVRAVDNATYFCTATDGINEQSQARIDLIALHKPIVELKRVIAARDSKSAIVQWQILSDGNTPIKKTILMVRNDSIIRTSSAPVDAFMMTSLVDGEQSSSEDKPYSSIVLDHEHQQWQRLDIPDEGELAPQVGGNTNLEPNFAGQPGDLLPMVSAEETGRAADADVTSLNASPSSSYDSARQQTRQSGRRISSSGMQQSGRLRSYNLTSLLPGVTYNFRLAAVNDMGQSNWTYLTATMPNEIPAQISEILVLSRSNDSLAIGWRRPAYDNAKTIRYEMQLFDLNRTLTLDANTNTSSSGSPKNNFMYIFVNLNPGTDYHFHVRACSRAGCSAYSMPKLLASTMDGESDEPLEVELQCHLDSGNVSISWLPPVNPRGQLLNYSVSLQSRAEYRNQTGSWTLDEWRTSMETSDNHTLSLDASGLLVPNTNYVARVCANNRSKHCGRQNPLTTRAQCNTPPDLPGEIPPGLQLSMRAVVRASGASANAYEIVPPRGDQSTSENSESLVLDVPYISRRNGTLNCIQVILIRLPKSFADNETSGSPLSDFLPSEPSDVKLGDFSSISADDSSDERNLEQKGEQSERSKQSSDERAAAYLADEFEPIKEVAKPKQVSDDDFDVETRILLGDGSQQECRSLDSISSDQDPSTPLFTKPGRRRRPLDGPLKARTYYTAFVKLILIRPAYQRKQQQDDGNKNVYRRSVSYRGEEMEMLTKFSGYVKPVKTSDNILQVSIASDQLIDLSTVKLASLFNLSSSNSLKEFSSKLGNVIVSNVNKYYKSASSYMAQNVKLDAVSQFIAQSSPGMQVFEIGVIMFFTLLLLLFVIYLFTIPRSLRRKRERKKLKKVHQAVGGGQIPVDKPQDQAQYFFGPNNDNNDSGQAQQYVMQTANGLQPKMIAATPKVHQLPIPQALDMQGYQQVASEQNAQAQLYGGPAAMMQQQQQLPQECPIHSSPMAYSQRYPPTNGVNSQLELGQQENPVGLVHQQGAYQSRPMYQGQDVSAVQRAGHYHHHHHTIHKHVEDINGARLPYERNFRTLRRVDDDPLTNGNVYSSQHMNTSVDSQTHQQSQQRANMTLNHQTSVMALAKRINKSIPLRLFGQIFELRLRNGWLREEFESLPRAHISANELAQNQDQTSLKPVGPFVKLRPQLIVSRNDTVSALISGNDHYDASIITVASLQSEMSGLDRRIICAKSPLDANSVWDFWRLIYEQEVSTIIMLTQNQDPTSGELRCAHYWPTHDNEETTILSPRNDLVLSSDILPAKFKIRLETLEDESIADNYKVRRLTLLVMATEASENIRTPEVERAAESEDIETNFDHAQHVADEKNRLQSQRSDSVDEEDLIIVERTVLQIQFYHWNTSNLANQMRILRFIETANEKHATNRAQSMEDSPGSVSGVNSSPMLVHCINGLGRSGLFVSMSCVLDELNVKMASCQGDNNRQHNHHRQFSDHQVEPKVNLFALVSRMRQQRELLLSPYRFYELLYQLTNNCINQRLQKLRH